jgi:hypothetical protein
MGLSLDGHLGSANDLEGWSSLAFFSIVGVDMHIYIFIFFQCNILACSYVLMREFSLSELYSSELLY